MIVPAADIRRASIEMGESVRSRVESDMPPSEERERFLELSLRMRIFWEEASDGFLLDWAKLSYRVGGLQEELVEELTTGTAPPAELQAACPAQAAQASFAEDHRFGNKLCDKCDGSGVNSKTGAFCAICGGDGLRPRMGRESIKKSDRGEGRNFVD